MWYVINEKNESILYRSKGDKPSLDNQKLTCIDGPDTSGKKVDEIYYNGEEIIIGDKQSGSKENNNENDTDLNNRYSVSVNASDTIEPTMGVPDIPADGHSETQITIKHVDPGGSVVKKDSTVYVRTSNGFLESRKVQLTDGEGSTTLRSVSETVEAKIEAYAPTTADKKTKTGKAYVQFAVPEFDSYLNILSNKSAIPADGESTAELTIRNEKKDGSLKPEPVEIKALTDEGTLVSEVFEHPSGTQEATLFLRSGTETLTLQSETYPSGTESTTADIKVKAREFVDENVKADTVSVDFLQ